MIPKKKKETPKFHEEACHVDNVICMLLWSIETQLWNSCAFDSNQEC